MIFKSNVCRACLSEAREIDLTTLQEQFSHLYNETIWQGLCFCSSLEPEIDPERMPQKICKKCLAELKVAFKFRRKCEEADKLLRRRIKDERYGAIEYRLTDIDLYLNPFEEESSMRLKDEPEYSEYTPIEDNSIESTYEEHDPIGDDSVETTEIHSSLADIDSRSECSLEMNEDEQKSGPGCARSRFSKNRSAEDNEAPKKRHICETCGKTFDFRQNMKRHKLVHTSDRPFTCEICKKSFKSRAGIRQHMFSHSKDEIDDIEAAKKAYQEKLEEEIDKPHKCQRCPKSFARRADLRRHGYAHTEERPLKCDECGNTYKSPGNLRQHLLSHKKSDKKETTSEKIGATSEKPHVCSHCDKSFARRHDLNRHMYVHTVDRLLECEFCDKLFKTRNALRSHFYTHGRLAFEKVTMNAKERKIRSEMERRQAIQEKRHMCEKCGKTFGRRHDLIRHEHVHSSDRPMECEICHKAFKSRGAIRQHLATHNAAFKHSCDKCKKRFAFPSALRLHMEFHATNKSLNCPFCEKRFGTDYAFNKHVAQHRRKQQIPYKGNENIILTATRPEQIETSCS